MHRLSAWLATACLVWSMSACGGGGSSSQVTPTTVSVPAVTGLTQASATAAITGAGLTVGTVTMQSSSTAASGDVISESPIAGTSVASGSAVKLVVSSGPATYPVSVTVSGLT
ncbi:MAG: PASTA domain-containing protein, partial [Candidatus Sulfotelmatobacter sp.]